MIDTFPLNISPAVWMIASLLTATWLRVIAMLAVALGAYIFYRTRVRKFRDESLLLKGKIVERDELLYYARENEKKAREEASLANRNKNALLAKLSHEIRTPMNGVIGMASLLEETELSAEQRQYTGAIRSSGESLIKVIKDILITDVMEYAKMDSEKIELEQKDFALELMIEEAIDVFAQRASLSEVELLYFIDDKVPAFITGDKLRLQQVLMNLFENAIKFTRKGQAVLFVNLVSAEASVIQLEFELRDTGSGMSPDQVATISAYLSKKSSQDTVPTDKGLGLVISKRLISLMGGQLSVTSALNEGSTFRFSIQARTSNQRMLTAVLPEIAVLAGKKLILVTENELLGDAMFRYISQLKSVTMIKSHPDRVIAEIKSDPDVRGILIDSRGNGLDVIPLASAVRSAYPEMPVIVLAYGTEARTRHPDLLNGTILKPLKPSLVHKTIVHVFNNKAQKSISLTQQSGHKLSEDFARQYPLRILIGEDDPMNQQLALMILKRLGYQADVAGNGKDVLEIVSNKTYDLILMDIQMPEMDGLEATRMIRLCLNIQPVVVAMTANAMMGDREECLRSGMDDYISKPINLDELTEILAKWAQRSNEKA